MEGVLAVQGRGGCQNIEHELANFSIVYGAPNFSFFFCADIIQALNRAKEIQPTVILQDLIMPQTDGLTLST